MSENNIIETEQTKTISVSVPEKEITNLKPCPICSGKAILNCGEGYCSIFCENCFAGTIRQIENSASSRKKAVREWNMRTGNIKKEIEKQRILCLEKAAPEMLIALKIALPFLRDFADSEAELEAAHLVESVISMAEGKGAK